MVMGQPSYVLAGDKTKAYLTVQGGQLGPVSFTLPEKVVHPFSVAPWHSEQISGDIPEVAKILRGDIFCLPFGLNLASFKGEQHKVHGETANGRWDFEEQADGKSLHVSMNTHVRSGRVDKWIFLADGETTVYEKHRISGMTGPMCFGHHAMLKFPAAENAGRFSCSKWVQGQVAPQPVELPEKQGYSLLKTGAVFQDMTRVPTITGETADLTRYPGRRGYEDVVALAADPRLPMAWNAVAFQEEGYAWFSLRDPKVLASTMLWFSNGGRYYPPWNGRHINVLGVEDNTAFYHYGLADSVNSNAHNTKGIKTFLVLDPANPLEINYIMGVAAIGRTFGHVVDILPGNRSITLLGEDGNSVKVAVDHEFLHRKEK